MGLVNDFKQPVPVIRYDLNNSNIFYVGTGEANTAPLPTESHHLKVLSLESIDAGTTWSLLESTENFDYITDIEIVTIMDNLIFSVASGTYQGDVHESESSDGVYKSTDDGITWSQVLPNILNSNTPYTPSDI